jgi:hypothetical protein
LPVVRSTATTTSAAVASVATTSGAPLQTPDSRVIETVQSSNSPGISQNMIIIICCAVAFLLLVIGLVAARRTKKLNLMKKRSDTDLHKLVNGNDEIFGTLDKSQVSTLSGAATYQIPKLSTFDKFMMTVPIVNHYDPKVSALKPEIRENEKGNMVEEQRGVISTVEADAISDAFKKALEDPVLSDYASSVDDSEV